MVDGVSMVCVGVRERRHGSRDRPATACHYRRWWGIGPKSQNARVARLFRGLGGIPNFRRRVRHPELKSHSLGLDKGGARIRPFSLGERVPRASEGDGADWPRAVAYRPM